MRSRRGRYIFTGLLGWFLHHAAGYIFSLYNFWGFLTETQFWYFDYMLLAFSGRGFWSYFCRCKKRTTLGTALACDGSNYLSSICLFAGETAFPSIYFWDFWDFLALCWSDNLDVDFDRQRFCGCHKAGRPTTIALGGCYRYHSVSNR